MITRHPWISTHISIELLTHWRGVLSFFPPNCISGSDLVYLNPFFRLFQVYSSWLEQQISWSWEHTVMARLQFFLGYAFSYSYSCSISCFLFYFLILSQTPACSLPILSTLCISIFSSFYPEFPPQKMFLVFLFGTSTCAFCHKRGVACEKSTVLVLLQKYSCMLFYSWKKKKQQLNP